MLPHARVSGSIDTNRLAKAVSRPGIDPRSWISTAVIQTVHVESEGAFADVKLLPAGMDETVRVGAPYAGPGYGDWNPLGENDEVLVAFPDGAFDAGGVIVARLHSASDPVPQEAIDHPDDRLIHVRSGQSLRIVVEGDGQVEITSGHVVVVSGDVKLGSATATERAVHGDAEQTALFAWMTAVTNMLGAGPPPAPVMSNPALVGINTTAQTGMQAALSTKVKVD